MEKPLQLKLTPNFVFLWGPFVSDTYDAVWSVEFLEHVGRNFHHNYIPIFRKAALIFVSHSQWGGWYVKANCESHWMVHSSPHYVVSPHSCVIKTGIMLRCMIANGG